MGHLQTNCVNTYVSRSVQRAAPGAHPVISGYLDLLQDKQTTGRPDQSKHTPVTASTSELFPANGTTVSASTTSQVPHDVPDWAPITASRGISNVLSLALIAAQ